ncbi:MAG TPA: hypothetical protein PLV92_26325, partial [Pirellulaceae bacterium]|nr:hypothetical protein [Pirellulaceae bacterium]
MRRIAFQNRSTPKQCVAWIVATNLVELRQTFVRFESFVGVVRPSRSGKQGFDELRSAVSSERHAVCAERSEQVFPCRRRFFGHARSVREVAVSFVFESRIEREASCFGTRGGRRSFRSECRAIGRSFRRQTFVQFAKTDVVRTCFQRVHEQARRVRGTFGRDERFAQVVARLFDRIVTRFASSMEPRDEAIAISRRPRDAFADVNRQRHLRIHFRCATQQFVPFILDGRTRIVDFEEPVRRFGEDERGARTRLHRLRQLREDRCSVCRVRIRRRSSRRGFVCGIRRAGTIVTFVGELRIAGELGEQCGGERSIAIVFRLVSAPSRDGLGDLRAGFAFEIQLERKRSTRTALRNEFREAKDRGRQGIVGREGFVVGSKCAEGSTQSCARTCGRCSRTNQVRGRT